MPEVPKQKRSEGQGWADPINKAAVPNTFTGGS